MPTIHDVAKACGVSVGTVSRALNDRAEVAAGTRQKVLKAAEQLGYRPNKLLAGLAAGQFRQSRDASSPSVAVLSRGGELGRQEEKWAREAASGHGFQYHFVDARHAQSGAALSRELYHRGMVGILFWRVLDSGSFWDSFDFRPFALVSLFERFSVAQPGITLVRHTPFNGFLRAWEACREQGYRRVSAILFDPPPRQPQNIRLIGAARHCLAETPGADRIEPFRITSFHQAELSEQCDAAASWIRANRLDAVILGAAFLRQIALKAKCPYAVLGGAEAEEAGFANPHPQVFDTAFWMLDLLVRSRRTGLSPHAGELIVNGVWQNGQSLLPHAKRATKFAETAPP